jgi:hypothetical protein
MKTLISTETFAGWEYIKELNLEFKCRDLIQVYESPVTFNAISYPNGGKLFKIVPEGVTASGKRLTEEREEFIGCQIFRPFSSGDLAQWKRWESRRKLEEGLAKKAARKQIPTPERLRKA